MDENTFKSRREEFLKIRDDSFESFDKTILTITSAGLALSLTFIDKVGKPFNKFTIFLLLAAWISWLLVLIANILSFYFAIKNMDKKIKDLDEKYSSNIDDDVKEEEFIEKKMTLLCNKLALYFFLIGTLSFVTYICKIQYRNYIKEGLETMKSKETKKIRLEVDGKEVIYYEAFGGKVESQPPISLKKKDEGSKNINEGKVESPQPPSRPKK